MDVIPPAMHEVSDYVGQQDRQIAVLTVFLALAVALFIVPGDPGPSPRVQAPRRRFPGLTVDEPAPVTGSSETAVLAGGCFWGVQGVSQHVKGVSQAVSG